MLYYRHVFWPISSFLSDKLRARASIIFANFENFIVVFITDRMLIKDAQADSQK